MFIIGLIILLWSAVRLPSYAINGSPGMNSSGQAVIAYIQQARMYTWSLDQPMTGLDLLNKASELDPENIAIMIDMGDLYAFKLKDYQKADKIYRKILAISPSVKEVSLRLGVNLFWNLEDRRSGVKIFRDLIIMYPDYADAHQALGDALSFQNDHAGAVKEHQKALSLAPGDVQSVIRLARDYAYGLKQTGTAVQMLEKFPLAKEARKEMGNIYKANKEYGKAIYEYEIALKLDPNDIGFCKYLAGVYWQEFKQYDLAVLKDDQAMSICLGRLKADPDNAYVLSELADLYLHDVAEKYHDDGRAIEQIDKILKLHDKNDQAYAYLGQIEFAKLRRWANPRKAVLSGLAKEMLYCRKALQINPYNFTAAKLICDSFLQYNEYKNDAARCVKNTRRLRWDDEVFIVTYTVLLAGAASKCLLALGLGLLFTFRFIPKFNDKLRYIVMLDVCLWWLVVLMNFCPYLFMGISRFLYMAQFKIF
jgi:tetratricopeptide (TPR) repeat protein